MDGSTHTVIWLRQNYPGNFEQLYKLLYRRLFFFARNFLMDEEMAQDVVQEVFTVLWGKGKTLKEDVVLESYLFTSVRNLCIDYHRKLDIVDRYQKHIQSSEIMAFCAYEEEESEREERMKKVISDLPDMQRKVLELSVVEGMKYREVAQSLSISEGTVHTHIKRAYKYIKEHLNVFACFMWFGW